MEEHRVDLRAWGLGSSHILLLPNRKNLLKIDDYRDPLCRDERTAWSEEKRRGVSSSAKMRWTALAVLAEINQRVGSVQPGDSGRVNGIGAMLHG